VKLAAIIMATKIFGLTPQVLGLLAIVVILGPLVLYWTLRSGSQIGGSREVYQEFAQLIGASWSPPKNQADTLGPGRVKGRYLDHKISIDSTAPTGAARNQLSETVIRVHFSRSLGLGLHAGSGTFRARKSGELELADPRLAKLLRPKAKDEAGARRLLGDPAVAEAVLTLDQHCRGVAIDDGTLACAVPLPTSSEELRASVDRVINAIEPFDRALAQ
jgi:hypothetical protein